VLAVRKQVSYSVNPMLAGSAVEAVREVVIAPRSLFPRMIVLHPTKVGYPRNPPVAVVVGRFASPRGQLVAAVELPVLPRHLVVVAAVELPVLPRHLVVVAAVELPVLPRHLVVVAAAPTHYRRVAPDVANPA
jgi:hypothetical protein